MAVLVLSTRTLGMGDLDDGDIILGLIQKTEEEVSFTTMKRW